MNRILPVLVFLGAACSAVPAPGGAQVASAEDPDLAPTIHVSANASVTRSPDVAIIDLAVETVAATAAAAGAENAERMDAVLAAVRGLGVDPSMIRTRRIELQPQYDQRRDRETREIVAYHAVNQVTVRLESVEGTGEVVDAAVEAGANRVTGIRFELSDTEAAYHEALETAIAQARAEAEVAAAALGLRLGAPIRVSTGGYQPPVPRPRYAAAMEMERAVAMPTPVEPGEVEVSASVSVIWRLES